MKSTATPLNPDTTVFCALDVAIVAAPLPDFVQTTVSKSGLYELPKRTISVGIVQNGIVGVPLIEAVAVETAGPVGALTVICTSSNPG